MSDFDLRKIAHSLVAGKALNWIVNGLAVMAALYHLVYVFIILQGTTRHYLTHVGLMTTLALLVFLRDKARKIVRIITLFTILIVVATILYVLAYSDSLEGMVGYISDLDTVIGILMIITMLISVTLLWGPVFVIMVAIFLAYFFWGHLLAGPLYHPYFSLKYIVSFLSTSLSGGIFDLVSTSANTIIYFMLFGAMIQAMGVMPAFFELGKAIGRVLRGGPAYVALTGSALVGMISGSAGANVVITGTFTIPAMKQSGFHPEMAGAVEAVCSSGGQITPPVLGTAAFIMAAFLGVPYVTVMQKSILGSLLYYITVFIALLFYCYGTKQPRSVGEIKWTIIYRRFPIFLGAVTVTTIMLMQYYSAGTACVFGIIATMVLGLLLAAETRSWRVVTKGLIEGAVWGAQIGVMLFAVGMLNTATITTGLAPKITVAMAALSGGNIILALFITAIVSLIVGLGLPIAAAYILVAILVLPSLYSLGIDKFAAHFFNFYYAFLGTITPPVATACLVACKIAGASFWGTCWKAMGLIILPLIFPFIIVLHPKLLNFPMIGWEEVRIILLLILALVPILAAIQRWFLAKLGIFARLIGLLSGVGITAYLFGYGNQFLIAGLVLVAMFFTMQISAVIRFRKLDVSK